MSNRPLRFIHASDLHLEQPASGIAEVPEHLREVLVEAPFWAAERLFETVLAEEAELLILSGDVIDPTRSGPYGPLFLVSQFERLAERKIEVYWAGGRSDPPAAWPTFAPLPPNVHVFPCDRLEQFLHERDGGPAVRLIGVSRPRTESRIPTESRKRTDPSFIIHHSSFPPSPTVRLSIAVFHGKADPRAWPSADRLLGPGREPCPIDPLPNPARRPLAGQPAGPPPRRARAARLLAGPGGR